MSRAAKARRGPAGVKALEEARRVESERQIRTGFRECVAVIMAGVLEALEAFPAQVAGELANLPRPEHEVRHAKLLRKYLRQISAAVAEPKATRKGGSR